MKKLLSLALIIFIFINCVFSINSYSFTAVKILQKTTYNNKVFLQFNYSTNKLDITKIKIEFYAPQDINNNSSQTQLQSINSSPTIIPNASSKTAVEAALSPSSEPTVIPEKTVSGENIEPSYKINRYNSFLEIAFGEKSSYKITIMQSAFFAKSNEISFTVTDKDLCRDFSNPVKNTYTTYSTDNEFLYFSNLVDLVGTASEDGNPKRKFDKNGIILTLINNAYVYDPIPIAQYGLQKYGLYKRTNDEKLIPTVLKMGDWLIDNQDKQTGKWIYNFDFSISGMQTILKKGWSCAMMQGQAMSLLSRCYLLTKDTKYLDAAKRAILPLNKDVENGGLRAWLDKDIFFEEYPTLPHSYVLNGFMFTLLGLYDYSTISNDNEGMILFNKGIQTLKDNIYKYDNGYVSIYHLGYITKKLPKHISTFYHKVHIAELNSLYDVTKEQILKDYADLWASYISH